MFKGLMTGVSGIRGVVGEGMTPEVALLWAGAFGTWVKGGKVVLSRDPRPTGSMLYLAVKAGLLAAGCDVDDAGIVPTPVGAMAVPRRGAAGGIIITASHNPQQWNALKFVRADGRMLTANDFKDLERIVTQGPLRSASWDSLGKSLDWNNADSMYLNTVTGIDLLDLDRIRRKKLKVALDCVNGAGSVIYPQLLELLGCVVVSIHCDGSGLFPRPPEPLPQNLGDLSALVVKEKCAIGFAVDPDGDRLAVVDETGTPIGEELTLALAIQTVLEAKPGPVVVNALTSQVIDDIAAEFSVPCHRAKVGEANVAALMKEVKAVAGGEGNGGVIFPSIHFVRDAGIGMALFLNRLSATKKSIKALKDSLPVYKMIKTTMPVGESDPFDLIENLAICYPHDQVSRIDGVRVSFPDGWVQARPSNTEPIFRIYAEARDEANAQQYLQEMLDHIQRLILTGKEDE